MAFEVFKTKLVNLFLYFDFTFFKNLGEDIYLFICKSNLFSKILFYSFCGQIVTPDVLPAKVIRPTSRIAEQSSASTFIRAGSSQTQYLDRAGKA